jgi:hypothetical protein
VDLANQLSEDVRSSEPKTKEMQRRKRRRVLRIFLEDGLLFRRKNARH